MTDTTPPPSGTEKNTPDPSADGVSHINCWSKANTQLGQWLSNFAHMPFRLKDYGNFASVEAFWYWLSGGGANNRELDHLRRLYGASAKSAGSRYEAIPMPDEEFREKICSAIRAKIEQNKVLRKAFVESTLPFFHYYVYGGNKDAKYVVVQKPEHQWQMDFLEALRIELNALDQAKVKELTDFSAYGM